MLRSTSRALLLCIPILGVAACGGGGGGGGGGTGPGATPPPAPTGLDVRAEGTTFVLSWQLGLRAKNTDAVFRVYRATGSTVTVDPSLLALETAEPMATLQGATAGVLESFAVTEVNGGLESAPSNTVSSNPLAAPTGVAAKATGTSFGISWQAVDGATDYDVYRGVETDLTPTPERFGVTTTATSAVLTGGVVGTTESFLVVARSARATSAPSDVARSTPIAMPAGLAVRYSGDSFELTWDASPSATGYGVYRGDAEGLTPEPDRLVASVESNAATVAGAPAGVAAWFVVTATTPDAESEGTAAVSVTPLAAPSGFALQALGRTLDAAWDAVPGATGYNVYRGTDVEVAPLPELLAASTTEPNAQITDGTIGATEALLVTATDANGESIGSASASVIPLAAPTGLDFSMNGADAEVTWNVGTGANGAEVFVAPWPSVDTSGTPVHAVTAPPVVLPALEIGDRWVAVVELGPNARSVPAELRIEVLGPTADPSDGLLADQWHIDDPSGEDAGVLDAWRDGYGGWGARIAIIDDGVETTHPDLVENSAPGSYDYVEGDDVPISGAFFSGLHGTAVAGLAAAGRDNGGVVGVAPGAELVGYNLLEAATDANELDALTRNASDIWVSNNSWGAPDGLGYPQSAPEVFNDAIEQGLAEGRNGYGTVYVWSAGNGALGPPSSPSGLLTDNSNLEERSNHRGVIAVGAVDINGTKAAYSEEGANLLVCAPSNETAPSALPWLATTDRTGFDGWNPAATGGEPGGDFADANYTRFFSGTSGAAPIVAGVAALILDANPTLSWRDVREILARSARVNDSADLDWNTNGAELPFNHKYGFGVVDAGNAVTMAKTWPPLPEQKFASTGRIEEDEWINDNGPWEEFSAPINGSGIQSIEFVSVLFHGPIHPKNTDLEVTLVAPTGQESVLKVRNNSSVILPEPFIEFRFGTNRHLGEYADGVWTLRVRDREENGLTGKLEAWQVDVWGH